MRRSRHRLRWVGLVGGLALALAGGAETARTATVLKFDTAEMSERAERIVHGKVLSKRSEVIEGTRMICTEYRVEVSEAWKGVEAGATELRFKQLGGVVGDRGLAISGAAALEVGEEVVVFLDRPNPVNGCSFTIGLAQGKYHVDLEASSGEKVVSRRLEQLDLLDAASLERVAPDAPKRKTLGKLRAEVVTAIEAARRRR